MSALTAAGSTRRWRKLRALILERDLAMCQGPGHTRAPAGTWAALHAPEDFPRGHDGRALVCGAYADHVDHVAPRRPARGRPAAGGDHPDNLRAMCAVHNLRKSNRPDTTTTTTTPAPRRWEWD